MTIIAFWIKFMFLKASSILSLKTATVFCGQLVWGKFSIFSQEISMLWPSLELSKIQWDSSNEGSQHMKNYLSIILKTISCKPDKDIHVFYLNRQFLSHP